jgi:gluconolactonase
VCPPGPFLAPVATNRVDICPGFTKYDWNEGPTWFASQGAFFFTNFVRGAAGPGDIIKYTPGGTCETWVAGVACNGITAGYDGRLITVCQGNRSVVAYDLATKQATVLASMYMGKPFDSPNDIVQHHNGTLYFSNPNYELGMRPLGFGPAFFYIDPQGTVNLLLNAPGTQPNGVALSPDEKTLYIEDDGAGIKTFSLDANGVPMGGPKPFASFQDDGLSVDCAGDLYTSSGTIAGPNGQKVGTFPGGTMAAFGGADNKTLFVAGQGQQLYTIQMNLPGPTH